MKGYVPSTDEVLVGIAFADWKFRQTAKRNWFFVSQTYDHKKPGSIEVIRDGCISCGRLIDKVEYNHEGYFRYSDRDKLSNHMTTIAHVAHVHGVKVSLLRKAVKTHLILTGKLQTPILKAERSLQRCQNSIDRWRKERERRCAECDERIEHFKAKYEKQFERLQELKTKGGEKDGQAKP